MAWGTVVKCALRRVSTSVMLACAGECWHVQDKSWTGGTRCQTVNFLSPPSRHQLRLVLTYDGSLAQPLEVCRIQHYFLVDASRDTCAVSVGGVCV